MSMGQRGHMKQGKERNIRMKILVIGAHPDDCEFFAAGTAVGMVAAGHTVKFVSVTNGDAGHMWRKPAELAEIRLAETNAADDYLGVESLVMDNHDGRLVPTVDIREELIRVIRSFGADIVISHRPWDYHPDHRATATLVQDTAYMVIVPPVCPETPALRVNPVYMYLWDEFEEPAPFRPDVIVPVDDVFGRKVRALHMMPSQFYEWLPWTFGTLDTVPSGDEERLVWLDAMLRNWMRNPYPDETAVRFGEGVKMVESFQVCPFGRRPSLEELAAAFPFVPEGGIRLPW